MEDSLSFVIINQSLSVRVSKFTLYPLPVLIVSDLILNVLIFKRRLVNSPLCGLYDESSGDGSWLERDLSGVRLPKQTVQVYLKPTPKTPHPHHHWIPLSFSLGLPGSIHHTNKYNLQAAIIVCHVCPPAWIIVQFRRNLTKVSAYRGLRRARYKLCTDVRAGVIKRPKHTC